MHCSFRSSGRCLGTLVPFPYRIARGLPVFVCVVIALGRLAQGASDVQFDTPARVACDEVGEDLNAAGPAATRLVEATFVVSAWTAADGSTDRLRYEYQFVVPSGAVEVVDYSPRTTQFSTVAGNVAIEETTESNKALNASVVGMVPPFGQGEGKAELGKKSLTHTRYELKPRQETAVVAGTLQRGTGVYFRLLPIADQVWEGAQEFTLVLRVPRSWRADQVFVRCEAFGEAGDRSARLGLARFVVGLQAFGDEEAGAILDALAQTEAELRQLATARQRDVQRHATPTVVHKLGELLDVAGPRIPDEWVERLVFGSASADAHPYVKHLPDDLRQLAGRYLEQKRRVSRLNGSGWGSRVATTSRSIR